AIRIGAIKAVVPAAFALVEHHIKERRQSRVRAAVEPDLNWVQICGIAKYLLLLRGPQRDVSAPPVRTPSLHTGADAESSVGKSNALIDFILVGVRWRPGIGVTDLPEVLDEFVTRFV